MSAWTNGSKSPSGSPWAVRPISSSARASSARSRVSARRAASSAAAGSMKRRTSVSARSSDGLPAPSCCHASTSASSRFHASRGRTRVPVFGLDSTSPFAARTLMASRRTVRLAPSSGSAGSSAPGRSCPPRIFRPIAWTTRSCRLRSGYCARTKPGPGTFARTDPSRPSCGAILVIS